MSILSTPTVFSNRRPSVDDTNSKVGGGTLHRRLTLPLENAHRIGIRRIKQQTIDQLESPLFLLPYELREQIWRYVLGGKCIAHDTGGFRFGDASNPWPPWEMPEQRKTRGLKTLGSLGWAPGRPRGSLSILITCRRAYSEGINLLYSSNLFYFRNPLTNWSLSSWRLLPQRLAQIRVLVIDETIGDPSITLHKSNRKHWKHFWSIINQMSRLRILYFNVDTLYPKIWTAEVEKQLLIPLKEVNNVAEMYVIVRWTSPTGQDRNWFENETGRTLVRWDSYDLPDELFKAAPEADLRKWIIKKVRALERGLT